jgi:ribokinase
MKPARLQPETKLKSEMPRSFVHPPAIPAPRIAVIGSSNTDLVLPCPRLPRAGETVLSGPLSRLAGGKGANQAVAAARAGARVTFIGAHGDDEFGRAARTALCAEGIDVRHFVKRQGVGSGIALILVGGKSRENLIAVAQSANDTLGKTDILRAEKAIAAADVIVAQLEVPLAAVTAAAELATAYHRPFILNPAPAQKLPVALLRLVHTLTPNENEVAMLTGHTDPRTAANFLHRKGCRQAVITLGSRGALLSNATSQQIIPAPKVRPVDTVGAGDCFTAWLAVGLASGMAAPDAVAQAATAASICVTRSGAQAAMPTKKEVASRR